MAVSELSLLGLPSEILLCVLALLPTSQLLPTARASRRCHALVLRELRQRLYSAGRLRKHRLSVQCHHPAAEILKVFMDCAYLSTQPLSPSLNTGLPAFDYLRSLYTRFTVYVQEDNQITSIRRQRSHSGETGDLTGPDVHLVKLDHGEYLDQLCMRASLIRTDNKHLAYQTHQRVGSGVVRFFRHWLAAQVTNPSVNFAFSDSIATSGVNDLEEQGIVWADSRKNIGLRFRICEITPAERAGAYNWNDEDRPVSYALEYEEVIIRSTELLFALEESECQPSTSGKVMRIALFG